MKTMLVGDRSSDAIYNFSLREREFLMTAIAEELGKLEKNEFIPNDSDVVSFMRELHKSLWNQT